MSAAGLLLGGVMALSASSVPASLAVGVWGGQGVEMTVSAEGARIELPCAHLEIDGTVSVGEAGEVRCPARWVKESPGPDRGRSPAPVEVQLEGKLEGERLTLAFDLPGGGRQTLELALGKPAKVMKCR